MFSAQHHVLDAWWVCTAGRALMHVPKLEYMCGAHPAQGPGGMVGREGVSLVLEGLLHARDVGLCPEHGMTGGSAVKQTSSSCIPAWVVLAGGDGEKWVAWGPQAGIDESEEIEREVKGLTGSGLGSGTCSWMWHRVGGVRSRECEIMMSGWDRLLLQGLWDISGKTMARAAPGASAVTLRGLHPVAIPCLVACLLVILGCWVFCRKPWEGSVLITPCHFHICQCDLSPLSCCDCCQASPP